MGSTPQASSDESEHYSAALADAITAAQDDIADRAVEAVLRELDGYQSLGPHATSAATGWLRRVVLALLDGLPDQPLDGPDTWGALGAIRAREGETVQTMTLALDRLVTEAWAQVLTRASDVDVPAAMDVVRKFWRAWDQRARDARLSLLRGHSEAWGARSGGPHRAEESLVDGLVAGTIHDLGQLGTEAARIDFRVGDVVALVVFSSENRLEKARLRSLAKSVKGIAGTPRSHPREHAVVLVPVRPGQGGFELQSAAQRWAHREGLVVVVSDPLPNPLALRGLVAGLLRDVLTLDLAAPTPRAVTVADWTHYRLFSHAPKEDIVAFVAGVLGGLLALKKWEELLETAEAY
ncbi:MAG: hypothetical protein M3394_01145, partial [Actinomycetota bacterium]|nr:hypothetical protein [Actinomycetota bacterium]